MPVRGFKRLINGVLRESMIEPLTDNQIRDLLYYALQCSDITDTERQEIERILDLR